MSPTHTQLAVLVARLEHELETLRLAVTASHYVNARDSVTRAKNLTEQLRDSL